MTATTARPKVPARVQCSHCGYSAEPGSSIAGHVAMAHPDVPIDTVAPKRSARNDTQHPAPSRASAPTAERLAVGAVLFRAHDAARHLENLLELEATDPRIAELMHATKRVRKSIAALLVEVALDSAEVTPPAD